MGHFPARAAAARARPPAGGGHTGGGGRGPHVPRHLRLHHRRRQPHRSHSRDAAPALRLLVPVRVYLRLCGRDGSGAGARFRAGAPAAGTSLVGWGGDQAAGGGDQAVAGCTGGGTEAGGDDPLLHPGARSQSSRLRLPPGRRRARRRQYRRGGRQRPYRQGGRGGGPAGHCRAPPVPHHHGRLPRRRYRGGGAGRQGGRRGACATDAAAGVCGNAGGGDRCRNQPRAHRVFVPFDRGRDG
mmetsp:Transcript_1363/g.4349  ORF Transcript_1363/g.4349 Transcript_1363/m.4349 type:complete len:241 (-) Transcript_1363:2317-3039(-)